MKPILYFAVGLIVLVSTGGVAMDLDTAKNQAFTNDLALAKESVKELQKNDDRATLVRVAKEARNHSIKIAAIKALGEIGKKEDGRILVALLDSANVAVVEGGSEQQVENNAMKRVLVEALAEICKTDAPKIINGATVSGFLSECKSKLDQLKE